MQYEMKPLFIVCISQVKCINCLCKSQVTCVPNTFMLAVLKFHQAADDIGFYDPNE